MFRALLLSIALMGQVALTDDAAAKDALQIYGLTLDGTRSDGRFCEAKDSRAPTPQAAACIGSPQALPRIHHVQSEATPAPHQTVHFETEKGPNGQTLDVWFAPSDQGGQSFMIKTWWKSPLDLVGTRRKLLEIYGEPTLEFTHADMEARGLRIFDLTLGVLIYIEPALSETERQGVAAQLQERFDPTGDELFGLPGSSVGELARLLGPDFRGAIIQIGESGFGHQSSVQAVLLDLNRARSVFNLPQ